MDQWTSPSFSSSSSSSPSRSMSLLLLLLAQLLLQVADAHPHRHPHRQMSEEEKDEVRKTFFWQQLLDKLHMAAPPNVTADVRDRAIPEPIRRELEEQEEMEQHWHNTQQHAEDNYYGKTTQEILIAKPSTACPSRPFAACLEVELPQGINAERLSSADLYMYNKFPNQSLSIYEYKPSQRNPAKARNFITRKPELDAGWTEVDVHKTVVHWVHQTQASESATRKHVIQVTCNACSIPGSPVAQQGENGAFIKLKYRHKGLEQQRRVKRSHGHGGRRNGCREGCCLHGLQIDAQENNNNRWILSPRTFHVNYCRGSCSFRLNNTPMMQQNLRDKLFYEQEMMDKVFNRCCVPTQMQSIKIVYYNTDGIITEATISDLKASACGCK